MVDTYLWYSSLILVSGCSGLNIVGGCMAGTAAQVTKTFDNKFSDLILEQFRYKIYDLANIDIIILH